MEAHRILLPSDPCPCGSGRTLMDCCYTSAAAVLQQSIEGRLATGVPIPQETVDQLQRSAKNQRNYGSVRPMVDAYWRGKMWIAVGEQLYSGDWKYFPDFLQDYIKIVLTPAWGKAELTKPLAERHPIMQWYDGMCQFQSQQDRAEDGTYAFVPDGCSFAYLLLAYDLYTLRHSQALQSVVVERLKKQDQFQGARYELFVAATCIRAGFAIEFEDETDGSRKHPEFRATHHKTGIELTVEAKSRHRPGVLGHPGSARPASDVRTRIGGLLNDALAKAGSLPHVVFIDVNVPPAEGKAFEKQWFKDTQKSIQSAEANGVKGQDQFDLVVFTNHPFHYVEPGETAPSPELISVFGKNPRVPIANTSVLTSIHDAANKFGKVPQHFESSDASS